MTLAKICTHWQVATVPLARIGSNKIFKWPLVGSSAQQDSSKRDHTWGGANWSAQTSTRHPRITRSLGRISFCHEIVFVSTKGHSGSCQHSTQSRNNHAEREDWKSHWEKLVLCEQCGTNWREVCALWAKWVPSVVGKPLEMWTVNDDNDVPYIFHVRLASLGQQQQPCDHANSEHTQRSAVVRAVATPRCWSCSMLLPRQPTNILHTHVWSCCLQAQGAKDGPKDAFPLLQCQSCCGLGSCHVGFMLKQGQKQIDGQTSVAGTRSAIWTIKNKPRQLFPPSCSSPSFAASLTNWWLARQPPQDLHDMCVTDTTDLNRSCSCVPLPTCWVS